MIRHFLAFTFLVLCLERALLCAEESIYGISGNPGAVNIQTGTGELGNLLQISKKSGVQLGGLWMGDYNVLLSGGDGTHDNRRWTGNNLFILDLSINLQKAFGWKGSFFGAEFLQFNGQPTNADAGVVQGYNSLPGSPPLNRSELYQLWIRQEFLDNKLSVRIGKTIPTYHFNNVSKPVPTEDPTVSIPSVSGLIYTPIFVNTTLLGAIGGYYNSVCGIVTTISPIKQAYVNLGVYDGNLAKGVQTTEAGLGTQSIPHSMAETTDPRAQGSLSMLSTFSAGSIAFLSGCVALLTNTWQDPTIPLGISMVAASYEQYFSFVGVGIVAISTMLFGFGTILGNGFNGSQCYGYLTQNKNKRYYLCATAIMIFLGAIGEVRTVWSVIDILLAFIAVPHMGALLLSVHRFPELFLSKNKTVKVN